MKKLLLLFLLLSPSLLSAKQSVKEQLQEEQQYTATLEDEVARLSNQKKALRTISYEINSVKQDINRLKNQSKEGVLMWLYRFVVVTASICTIVLTIVCIYLYASPYNALKKWGVKPEVLGFDNPEENNNNNNNSSPESQINSNSDNVRSNNMSGRGRGRGRGRGGLQNFSYRPPSSSISMPRPNQGDDFDDYNESED